MSSIKQVSSVVSDRRGVDSVARESGEDLKGAGGRMLARRGNGASKHSEGLPEADGSRVLTVPADNSQDHSAACAEGRKRYRIGIIQG